MADVSVVYNGRFARIDTDIKSTDSYLFDGLNGRQGDDGRRVYIQFLDNGFPHDLTGQHVELQGKDAKGMTKTTDSMEHVFSPKAGTCSFLVPGAFYQAAGPYQNAYFVIKTDGSDQVVSTIPVSFSVMENAIFMTTGEMTPYLANVDGRLAEVSKRVGSISSTFNQMLDAITDGVNSVGNQVAEYEKEIKSNKVATQGGSNSFTGTNHFSNLIIDNWSGSAVDDLKSYVDGQIKAGIGSIKLPAGNSRDNPNRNITFSNGASASSATDSMYCWKETYNGFSKIYAVGKVIVNSMTQGGHFSINFPYQINAGDFVRAESFSDYMTKGETNVNGGIDVFMYGGDFNNREYWFDIEIAQTN